MQEKIGGRVFSEIRCERVGLILHFWYIAYRRPILNAGKDRKCSVTPRMHQIRFWLGLRPGSRTPCGISRRLPRLGWSGDTLSHSPPSSFQRLSLRETCSKDLGVIDASGFAWVSPRAATSELTFQAFSLRRWMVCFQRQIRSELNWLTASANQPARSWGAENNKRDKADVLLRNCPVT